MTGFPSVPVQGPLPASLPSEPSGHVSAQRRLFPPPGAKVGKPWILLRHGLGGVRSSRSAKQQEREPAELVWRWKGLLLETVPAYQPPAAGLSWWPSWALPSLCLQQPGRSPSGILRLQPACFFACLLGLQRPMEEEQRLKPTMPGVVQAEGAAMDAWALGSGQLAPLPRALPAVPGQSFLRSRGAAWKAVGLSRALRSVGT